LIVKNICILYRKAKETTKTRSFYMKKPDLKSLALMGITGGLFLSSQCNAADYQSKGAPQNQNKAMHQSKEMSESELMEKLDANHKAMFKDMTPEGKKMALKLANQTCAGTNECKGLNACKTDDNGCAGKGGCKGQSKCSFKDKNKAVEAANQHMQQKRTEMQK
jgi:hypothetical protein